MSNSVSILELFVVAVNPMSMQNLVTLAAITAANSVSPTGMSYENGKQYCPTNKAIVL